MTAKVQPQEVAQLRTLGAVDVITKPFDPHDPVGPDPQNLGGNRLKPLRRFVSAHLQLTLVIII